MTQPKTKTREDELKGYPNEIKRFIDALAEIAHKEREIGRQEKQQEDLEIIDEFDFIYYLKKQGFMGFNETNMLKALKSKITNNCNVCKSKGK